MASLQRVATWCVNDEVEINVSYSKYDQTLIFIVRCKEGDNWRCYSFSLHKDDLEEDVG